MDRSSCGHRQLEAGSACARGGCSGGPPEHAYTGGSARVWGMGNIPPWRDSRLRRVRVWGMADLPNKGAHARWMGKVTPNKGGDRKSADQTPRSADLISMPEAEDSARQREVTTAGPHGRGGEGVSIRTSTLYPGQSALIA